MLFLLFKLFRHVFSLAFVNVVLLYVYVILHLGLLIYYVNRLIFLKYKYFFLSPDVYLCDVCLIVCMRVCVDLCLVHSYKYGTISNISKLFTQDW